MTGWRRFAPPGEPITLDPLLPNGWSQGEWLARRESIWLRWTQVLGAGPRPPPPSLEDHGSVAGNGYCRHRVTFHGACGDPVPAFLLVPAAVSSQRLLPAVIALHQTTAVGKLEPVGLAGDPELRYGHELARRGYVVLAPDEFTAGERVAPGEEFRSADFERDHPGWSGIGRMLADHRQAVSVLRRLPYVDPARIGVIGHSLGGLNSWWLLGADPRVAAAAVSCGYCTFAGDPDPLRWAADGRFRYLHRLAAPLRCRGAPFEHHEILALCAPRPLFLWATRQDEVFPHWEGVRASVAAVREVYRGYGAPENLELELGDGCHGFSAAGRGKAYDFLDRQLRHARAS